MNPMKFILRGKIPALKNNRMLTIRERDEIDPKTGKPIKDVKIPPNVEVIKAIRGIKHTVARQLPAALAGAAPLFREPLEVRLAVLVGFYYLGELPNADVDNAVTTVQEALADLIYENDRQVCGTYQDRVQFKSQNSLHTVVYLWLEDKTIPFWQQLQTLFTYAARAQVNPIVTKTKRNPKGVDVF